MKKDGFGFLNLKSSYLIYSDTLYNFYKTCESRAFYIWKTFHEKKLYKWNTNLK